LRAYLKNYQCFYNIIIIIIFGIFLIIAAAYIVLAKVFLSILVVLGPLFISLALFPATRQFFSAWVNQVVNYNLYFLLINIVGAIFISYMNATFDQTTLLSDAGVIHLIFVCLFFAVILLKLPEMASGLAGGIAANGFGALSSTISSSQRMFSGGGKSGGGKSSSQSKSSNTMKPEKTGN
jgi:type IV secretion system protein VirB6